MFDFGIFKRRNSMRSRTSALEIPRSQEVEPPAGNSAGPIQVACCRGQGLRVAISTPLKVEGITIRPRRLEHPQPSWLILTKVSGAYYKAIWFLTLFSQGFPCFTDVLRSHSGTFEQPAVLELGGCK